MKLVLRSLLIGVVVLMSAPVLSFPLSHSLTHLGPVNRFLTVSRLWLSISFFGGLLVQAVRLVGWLSGLAMKALPSAQQRDFDPVRRTFLRSGAFIAAAVPFAASAYGFASERLSYRVEKVEVPISNLPAALDGLRIVHLSDIHIGDFMPRAEVRRAVEMAGELKADLAVITGDLISSNGRPLEDCISELSKLHAPLGIWGCNGNHEAYSRVENISRELFQRYGMRLLRGESAELRCRGESINLIGVDYQGGRRLSGERLPMLPNIGPLIRKDIPNILLSHNPNAFYRAAALGIELTLSGHTHGGQVSLESVDRNLSPARLFTRFTAGMYFLPFGDNTNIKDSGRRPGAESSALYVNRGLGTVLIPVRIGTPPEITLLTLRTAAV